MVNFYLALADLLADGFVPLATFADFSVEGTTGRTMYAYHETPGGKQTTFVSFSIIHFCLNRRRFSTRLLFMSCDKQSGRNQTRFDLSYFIQCWGTCCSLHRLRWWHSLRRDHYRGSWPDSAILLISEFVCAMLHMVLWYCLYLETP